MPFTIYEVTVPNYRRLLNGLSAIIDKAAAHAVSTEVEPSVFITARLYPDMWSFGEQVRSTCSWVVRGTSRLAGIPIPNYTGADATFDDLKARIAWAIAHLDGLDRKAFAGVEERIITFPSGDTEKKMTGSDYLLTFSMPNFYFHLTASYAILRHNGVPIGKDDFLG